MNVQPRSELKPKSPEPNRFRTLLTTRWNFSRAGVAGALIGLSSASVGPRSPTQTYRHLNTAASFGLGIAAALKWLPVPFARTLGWLPLVLLGAVEMDEGAKMAALSRRRSDAAPRRYSSDRALPPHQPRRQLRHGAGADAALAVRHGSRAKDGRLSRRPPPLLLRRSRPTAGSHLRNQHSTRLPWGGIRKSYGGAPPQLRHLQAGVNSNAARLQGNASTGGERCGLDLTALA